ncbi:glycoside hydrolase family 15 protein [Halomonas sp. McH1-25]|uniref:glycoside hydrolase family 15 protein n=1 Tax=unclassified Halomonas TaxID=2609666 RepID=UPI001EF62212|nr:MULTISPECIES: glycoside hydrolase family 15 protein [unclassified Halomonas]MCG7600855.1 glycoside hydrolase family 15 protein [Halomonas sp. McH1-25]MCP1343799.1 glycoside hydrolase family 15 protein [Halomonas sp. FL8]MCP1360034.1 glycoside hydrolase family 15 protein [Halomonas sp. BBD45]
MPHHKRIEDYGFIGNMRTAALVDRDASIDWLCLPRFDSDACCAALVGEHENGYWKIWPSQSICAIRRRYVGESLILETEVETPSGRAAIIDFMPLSRENDSVVDVIRIVEGREGCVDMRMDAAFRFGYGRIAPWVRIREQGITGVAGPDGIRLETPVPLVEEDNDVHGSFTVSDGERIPFVLTWYRSFCEEPPTRDAEQALKDTADWWTEWSSHCEIEDKYREPVVRSLITLKALTHVETGGMVGAATTSLPEEAGGGKNWDYRFTWLRDATFTLYALLSSGYRSEACAWREWLLRAVAGDPSKLQPIYGLAGERRLYEHALEWLNGFNGSQPVRIGNDAYQQLQLDIFGEVMDGLHFGRVHNIEPNEDIWAIQCKLLEFLETHWQEKGMSLWEHRGPARHYTHSKVMSWVAVDRAIKSVEEFGLEGDIERWRQLRQQIHDEVCAKGFNPERNAFVQYYGAEALDASLLLIPQVGFLPADDPRMVGTIDAIQQELVHDGFVYRFQSEKKAKCGLTDGEGAFMVCGFWLVDALVMLGRQEEAEQMFDKLLAVRNDLGLLAEEYDPIQKCQLGNFPQAFSHVGLINSAHNLSCCQRGVKGPAEERGEE